MILTTKGRFAVMALVDIRINYIGCPISLSDISKRQNINIGYLEQIFIKLKKAGIVESFRGQGGGYVLSKKSKLLTISNIMLSVDENIKMTRCSSNAKDGCMIDKSICRTHHLWEVLENKILNFLSNVTIEDVCNNNLYENRLRINHAT